MVCTAWLLCTECLALYSTEFRATGRFAQNACQREWTNRFPLPAHYHNQEFQRITNDNLSIVNIVTFVFTVNCIDFLSFPKRL